jgi:hypothetical protein
MRGFLSCGTGSCVRHDVSVCVSLCVCVSASCVRVFSKVLASLIVRTHDALTICNFCAAAMTVLVLEMLGEPASLRDVANLRTFSCDDGTVSATVRLCWAVIDVILTLLYLCHAQLDWCCCACFPIS